MKNQTVTLQQADNDDDLYIVDSLVNCIEPKVGTVLPEREVRLLIQRRDLKVNIKRAKG